MSEIGKSLYGLQKIGASLGYASQFLLANVLLGRRPPKELENRLPGPEIVWAEIKELFANEYEEFSKRGLKLPDPEWGDYVRKVNQIAQSLIDIPKVKKRQAEKNVQDVPMEGLRSDLPNYYTQNFHFQSDGWFSDKSADIYDHQVEVLFAGCGQSMRRSVLPILDDEMSLAKIQGKTIEDMKFLDVACGTASLAKEFKHNWPNASLTLLDASAPYLKKARSVLSDYPRCDFVEALAEEMPFKDDSFDSSYCIFLFHELPERIRYKVAHEIYRVTKTGGCFVFADSIQKDDKPYLNASLELFPVNYHEPYYLQYIESDLRQYFPENLWKIETYRTAFYTKAVAFRKL